MKLNRDLFLIGRRGTADLPLNSADVSREHAEIVRDGDQYRLRDRGSRYGTFVNGEQVTERALKSAKDAGVTAKVALIPERPVDALLSMGAEHDARLIVVGTYGEHPIKGAILGATPYKLVQVSDRPVLVVPPD